MKDALASLLRGEGARRSGLAYAICLGLVALSFAAFGFTLDRYPVPFIDEAFFNYPAIHYLQGRGFAYDAGMGAPHPDTIWAYHGTFYPWMQVAVFSVFGVSQMACRMPQYLAAHLAVAALAVSLVRRRLPLAGVALALLWLGDRSAQEVQYGRPEGLCLLALVIAYLGVQAWIDTASPRWSAVAGLGAGLAAGLSPAGGLFLAPVLAYGLALTPRGLRLRAALGCAAGLALPTAFQLWTWRAGIGASIEQFRWHLAHVDDLRPFSSRVVDLFHVIGWARAWLLGETAATIFLAVALARRGSGPLRDLARSREGAWVTAAFFSVVAGLVFCRSSKLPYYLVLVTVWPIVGLGAFLEGGASRPPTLLRRAGLVVALLGLLAWVPSVLWNGLRCRDAIVQFPHLGSEGFARQLAAVLPRGARVIGSPSLIIPARRAGIDFEPFPFFAQDLPPDPQRYILREDYDVSHERRLTPEAEAAHAVVYRGLVFPDAGELGLPFQLQAPAQPR